MLRAHEEGMPLMGPQISPATTDEPMEPIEPMDLEAGGANRLHAPVVLSRVVNPFAMKPYRWTLAQKAKLLVCGLTLFPIRLLLLLVATPLMALLVHGRTRAL